MGVVRWLALLTVATLAVQAAVAKNADCGELEDWQECLCSNDDYQVRHLHRGLWVSTTVHDKSLTTAYNNARFRLSKFLNGNNDRGTKIQRQSPYVLQTFSGKEDKREVTVSVLLPKKLWKMPPIPKDSKVVLEIIPETIMYVRIFPQKAAGFVADREAKRFFQLLIKNEEPIIGVDDYYYIFQYKRSSSKPSVNEIAIFATNKHLHEFYSMAEGVDKSDTRLPRCLQRDCSPNHDTCGVHSVVTWSKEDDVINVDLERECQKDLCTVSHACEYKLEKSYTPSTEVRKYLEPHLLLVPVDTCNVEDVNALGQPILFEYMKDLGLMKEFSQMYVSIATWARENTWNKKSCPNQFGYLYPVPADFKGDATEAVLKLSYKNYKTAVKCMAGYADEKTLFDMAHRLREDLHKFGVDHCAGSFNIGQYNSQSRLFNRLNEVLLDVKPSCSWHEGDPIVDFRLPENRLASVEPLRVGHHCDHSDDEDHHHSDCLVPQTVKHYGKIEEKIYNKAGAVFVTIKECSAEAAERKAMSIILKYINGHNKEDVSLKILKPILTLTPRTWISHHEADDCDLEYATIAFLPEEQQDSPPEPLDDKVITVKAGDFVAYQLPYHVPPGDEVFGHHFEELARNMSLSMNDLGLAGKYFKTGGVADYDMGSDTDGEHFKEIWFLKRSDVLEPFFRGSPEDRTYPEGCPSDTCYVPEILGENAGFIEHKFHNDYWVCIQSSDHTCDHPSMSRSMVKAVLEYFTGSNEAGAKANKFVEPAVRTHTLKTPPAERAAGTCKDTFELCAPVPKGFSDGEPPAPTNDKVVIKKGESLQTYVVKKSGSVAQGLIDEALKDVRESLDKHGMLYDQSVDVVYTYIGNGWSEDEEHQNFYAGYAMAPWGNGLGTADVVNIFPSDCPHDTCFVPEKIAEHHGFAEHKFNIGNFACAKGEVEDCANPAITAPIFTAIRGYFEGKNEAEATAGIIQPGVFTWTYKTGKAEIAAGKCRDLYEFCVPIPRDFSDNKIPTPTEDVVYIKTGASLQTYVTRKMGFRDSETYAAAIARVRKGMDVEGLEYDQSVHVYYGFGGLAEEGDFGVLFAGFAMPPWGNGLANEVAVFPADCPNDLCFPPTDLGEHDGLIEHKIDADNWVCTKKAVTNCTEWVDHKDMFPTVRRYFTGSNTAGLTADLIFPAPTSYISKTNETEIAAGICKDEFEFCVPLPREYQKKEPPAPTDEGVYIKKTKGFKSYVVMRKGFKTHEAILKALKTARRSLDDHGVNYDSSVDVVYTYTGPAEEEDYQVFFAGYADPDWTDGLGKGLTAFPEDCPSGTCFLPNAVDSQKHKFTAKYWICYQSPVYNCGEPDLDPYIFHAVRSYFEGNNKAGITADIILPGITTYIARTSQAERVAGVCKDVFEFCVPYPRNLEYQHPPEPKSKMVYVKSAEKLQTFVTRKSGFPTQEAINKALSEVRKSLDKKGLSNDQSANVFYNFDGLMEDRDYQVFFAGYPKAPWGDGLATVVEEIPPSCPNKTCFVPEIVQTHGPFLEHKFDAENWVCVKRNVIHCRQPELSPSMYKSIRSYFQGNNDAGKKADIILPGITTYISNTTEIEAAAQLCRDIYEFCVPLPEDFTEESIPSPTEQGVYIKEGASLQTFVTSRAGYRTQEAIEEGLKDVHRRLDREQLGYDQTVDVVYTYAGPSESADYQIYFVGYAKAPWGNGHGDTPTTFPDSCPSDTCYLPEVLSERKGFKEHKFNAENWACVQHNVTDCGNPQITSSMGKAIRDYFSGKNADELKADIIYPGLSTLSCLTTKAEKAAGICKDLFEFCVPLPKSFLEGDAPPAPTEDLEGVYLKTGSLQAYVTRTTGYRTQKAIGKALKRVRKSLDKHNLDYDQTVDVVYTYGGPNEDKRYEVFYAGFAKAPWGNGRRQTVVDIPASCPSSSCFVPETKEAHSMLEHKFDVENWVCVKRNVIHCGPPELSASIFESIRAYFSGGNKAGKTTDAIMQPGVKTLTAKTGKKAAAGFECHDTFEFCVPLPEQFSDLPASTVPGVYLKTGAKLHTYVSKRTGFETQTAIDSALHHVDDCLHRHAREFDETVDVVYSFTGATEAHDHKVFYVGYAKAPWGDGLGNGVLATPTDCPSNTCFLPEITAEHKDIFEHKFHVENWVCVKRVMTDCSKPDFSTADFKYIRKYFSGNNAASLKAEVILPGVTTYTKKTPEDDISAGICKDVYEFCVPVPRDLKGDPPAPTDEGVYIKKGASLQTFVTKTKDRRTQAAINEALTTVREDLNTHGLDYDQTVDVVYSYHGPSEDHDYQVFFAGYAKAPWGNGLGEGVVAFPKDCPNNNCFLPEVLSEDDGFIEHKFDAGNWVCVHKEVTDCSHPHLDQSMSTAIRNYFKGENEAGKTADLILPGVTTMTHNGSTCPTMFEFCVPLPKDMQEGEPPAPTDKGVTIKKGASLQAYVTRRTGFRDQKAINDALYAVTDRLDKNGLEYDQTVDVVYTYAGPSESQEHQVFFAGYVKAPWGDGLGKGVVDFPSSCPSDTCFLPETVGEKEGFVEHKFETENWVCMKEDVRRCGHPEPSMDTFQAIRGYFSGKNDAEKKATYVFPGVTSVTLSKTVQRDRAIGICNDVFEFCVPLPKDWPQDEPPVPSDEHVYIKKGASLQAYVTRRIGFRTQEAISAALQTVRDSLNRHGLQYDQSVDVVYTYTGPTENQGYGVFFAGYAKAPWGNGLGEGVVDYPSTCPSDTCFLPEVVSENEGFIEHKFAIENWVCAERQVFDCGEPELSPSMYRGIRRYFSGYNEAKATADIIVPGPSSYIAKTSTYERDIGVCNDVFELCVPVPDSLNDGEPPAPTEKGVVLKKGATLHTYVTRRTGYLTQGMVEEALDSVQHSLDAQGLDYDASVDVVYDFMGPTEQDDYIVNFIGYAKAPWGGGLRNEVKEFPEDCPSDTCFLPETVGETDGLIEHKFTAENWVCVQRNVIDCGEPDLSPSMFESLRHYKIEAGMDTGTYQPGLTALMSKTEGADKLAGSCKDMFEFCVPLTKDFQEGDPPTPTVKGVVLRKGVSLQTYVVKRTGYRSQEAIDGALHSVRESLEGSDTEYDQTVDVVYSFAGPTENSDYQVYFAGYAKAGWGGAE
ncbi:uncharacterized protein LOC118420878 isoform X1 [Branchiostoma floridae]|uniref:Uncharacterized protein LOC118420878 isoform X1 n=1 Tax=Branchiostoma floridae TaxID=7739 RepID=A0A9J7MWA2_BRAFL|nr:uncharacterized protein LOC118420878 isoform X1 [Branchiostoma floridae]